VLLLQELGISVQRQVLEQLTLTKSTCKRNCIFAPNPDSQLQVVCPSSHALNAAPYLLAGAS
jgi:hypothetical protein